MDNQTAVDKKKEPARPGIFSLLKPYRGLVFLLILFALLSNGINLILPRIIAHGIDSYPNHYVVRTLLWEFISAAFVVFVFILLQGFVQSFASEKVARDLRNRLSGRISLQTYAFVEQTSPSKLLTNLTSDVDAIKSFVSQAIVSIASSIIIIIGACIMLYNINWKLASAVVLIIPIIGGTFYFVLKKVRAIFIKSRLVLDTLNKVITESILGAAIIRVLNAQQPEYEKFLSANTEAKSLGFSILKLFAGLIPIIIFTSNVATLSILMLGGHFVINHTMTLGDFAAFNSYLALLIFPILVIGFMSNVIAQASASFQRIQTVLDSPVELEKGSIQTVLKGHINIKDLSLVAGQKTILKHINLDLPSASSMAIIGPTAAGKTQLLYLLTGLTRPTEGRIEFDGHSIDEYLRDSFYSQVGFVFQDSIIFNMSIRENIAFSSKVTEEDMRKAIETAELNDFIGTLPQKLDAIVSERGTSLSGGQKQRIMLARALAINPKVLLLDDFTARVDGPTETKILNNVRKNYPGISLISVTQKISSAEMFDQVIVLMEGEIVASGTHSTLMKESPEYVQIYNSQQSTSNYELQS